MGDKYTNADWQNSALITIDTQNDFTVPNSPFKITGTLEIVPKMRQVLDTFRSMRMPIIHVIRLYNPDGSNVDLCRRRAVAELGKELVIAGTKGAELVEELKPFSSLPLLPPPSLPLDQALTQNCFCKVSHNKSARMNG